MLVLREGTVEACARLDDAVRLSPWLAERVAEERDATDMAALVDDLVPGLARPTGRA